MPPNTTISLQDIWDGHIDRLMACRDMAEFSHAGISMLTSDDYLKYQKILPPKPRSANPLPDHQIKRLALFSLCAHAIQEIIVLHGVLFTEIWLCLELSRLEHQNMTSEVRNALSLELINGRPATIQEAIDRLEILLPGGFPWKKECESLQKLYQVASTEAMRQPNGNGNEPVTLKFCVPRMSSAAQLPDGSSPFDISSEERMFSERDSMQIDPRMIYEVFFTAFAVSRGLVETCKDMLVANSKAVPTQD